MLITEHYSSDTSRQWDLLPAVFFKTEQAHYIFDVNQVNFLEVNEIVFKIVSLLKQKSRDLQDLADHLPGYSLAEIQDALNDIEEIKKQGFLQPHEFQRANPHTLPIIKKHLTSNLQGLYLNITSKCNLACSYCVFGGAYNNVNSLEQREMSWEVAQKAIEFFLSQSRKDGTLRVDFFGGEPILSFPLIERIVNTLKERLKPRNQDLVISICSNGTIMNEKIADFLINHQVFFQISMDGEKEIHNAKRKFKNSDIGSFDAVINTLQFIYDRNPGYFTDRVRLKGVLTTDSLDSDGFDFLNIPLVKILNDVKHFSIVNQTPHYNVQKDQDFFSRIHILGKILLQRKGAATIEELLKGLDYKKKLIFYVTLYEFFPIQVNNSLRYKVEDAIPFTKNCLIGFEGCVNVDGSISICYKSNSFIIGNVLENTWYFDQIEKFHALRYSRTDNCKYCFVQRFCNLCYEKLTGKENQFETSFQDFCEFNRAYYRIIFEYMLPIMENNPGLWDELQNVAEQEREALLKKAKAKKEKSTVLN